MKIISPFINMTDVNHTKAVPEALRVFQSDSNAAEVGSCRSKWKAEESERQMCDKHAESDRDKRPRLAIKITKPVPPLEALLIIFTFLHPRGNLCPTFDAPRSVNSVGLVDPDSDSRSARITSPLTGKLELAIFRRQLCQHSGPRSCTLTRPPHVLSQSSASGTYPISHRASVGHFSATHDDIWCVSTAPNSLALDPRETNSPYIIPSLLIYPRLYLHQPSFNLHTTSHTPPWSDQVLSLLRRRTNLRPTAT